MNTPDMVQAAEALAFEAAAIETRYSAVKQAYDDLDTVTPTALEPYNAYLKAYHAQSQKQHVFTMEMITTLQARMAEVERSLAETRCTQSRIRGIWTANEAEAILLRADPDVCCPTCGYGYDTEEGEDIAP